MIGPSIPAHLLKPAQPDEAGPSSSPRSTTPPASIGPSIPTHLLKSAPPPPPPDDDEEDDEDAFLPALPPGLPGPSAQPQPPPRQVGPTFPSRPPPDSDSDDDYGPMPLPAGAAVEEEDDNDGVREFIEREKRREQQIEESKQPKALKRDDWMLAPPSSSDLFSSLDPTKLKNRQFSRSTTDKKSAASNLWTETPQERQQRLADEISGKRKRAENAATTTAEDEDLAKRRKRDRDLREQVEAHNKSTRTQALVDMHSTPAPDPEDAPTGIWDHGRDMALSGRLMDEKSRQKMLRDARGLGDRFGHGKSGGFL